VKHPSLRLAASLLALGALGCATRPVRPSAPLRVLLLPFEDASPGRADADWGYLIDAALERPLAKSAALSMLPDSAVPYARRKLGVTRHARMDPMLARRMGTEVQAEAVIVGSFARRKGGWRIAASVVHLDRSHRPDELAAVAADIYTACDELLSKLARELHVPEGSALIVHRRTSSPAAQESLAHAMAAYAENRPCSESEELARAVLGQDPACATAHLILAGSLAMQGRFEQAEREQAEAQRLAPENASIRMVHGILHAIQGRMPEAERAYEEALRLDPRELQALIRLGELRITQGRPSDALQLFEQARRIDPYDPVVPTKLAYVHVGRLDREAALAALQEAERLGADDVNVQQGLADVHDRLRDNIRALRWSEAFLAAARKQGISPALVARFERRAAELGELQTMHVVEAPVPRQFTAAEIDAVMAERLTTREQGLVVDPFAVTPQMIRWAEQLTAGARTDEEKARRLFDELVHRLQERGDPAPRTAPEVFVLWREPIALLCQDHTMLFVALARAVQVPAFYVLVEQDHRGVPVHHACAGLPAERGVLLVDPGYRWFGVPHRKVIPLDDAQSRGAYLFGFNQVERGRTAMALAPDVSLFRVALADALIDRSQLHEANQMLDELDRMEPGRWDVLAVRGYVATKRGDHEEARTHFQESVTRNPVHAHTRLSLARALLALGRRAEALAEFRTALTYAQLASEEWEARHAIQQLENPVGRSR